MSREKLIRIAKERGFTEHIRNNDGSWRILSHNYYPFVLELWPDTNEFLLRYNTGVFSFQSNKCGSFDDDKHFSKILRPMRTFITYLREAEIDIDSRRKI